MVGSLETIWTQMGLLFSIFVHSLQTRFSNVSRLPPLPCPSTPVFASFRPLLEGHFPLQVAVVHPLRNLAGCAIWRRSCPVGRFAAPLLSLPALHVWPWRPRSPLSKRRSRWRSRAVL